MREFLLTRLAALACAIVGVGLVLVVLLDLLPRGALLDGTAWARSLDLYLVAEPWQRLAVTLPLVAVALIVALLGLVLGAAAGLSRYRPLQRFMTAIASALALVPPFWLGLLLAIGIGGALRWLPASGFVPWDNPVGALASLFLPALALGLPQAGALALRTRDLFAAAPPRLPPRQARREQARLGAHATVLALPTLLGTSFAAILVGAVLVENVFYLPGLGRFILGAAVEHDLAGLRSGLFILALVAASALALSAVLRAAIDPELRG
jgi:peptide/nickel transport system permease protein